LELRNLRVGLGGRTAGTVAVIFTRW